MTTAWWVICLFFSFNNFSVSYFFFELLLQGVAPLDHLSHAMPGILLCHTCPSFTIWTCSEVFLSLQRSCFSFSLTASEHASPLQPAVAQFPRHSMVHIIDYLLAWLGAYFTPETLPDTTFFFHSVLGLKLGVLVCNLACSPNMR